MVIISVAVEKLSRQEFAEIASRQEAPQTIFPSLLDIFYYPIFDFLRKPSFPTPTSVLDTCLSLSVRQGR
jgi:hypothetical protein